MTELPQLPFDRETVLDIAPLHAALRRTAPITPVRTPAGDVAWLVTSHAHTKSLFADRRLGRSHPDPARAPRISGSALLGGPMGAAATETAHHSRLRALLAPAFSARRMNRLRTHVDELVADLLDRLAAHGAPADLHEALSFPLPVLVICELLGVPYEDRDVFRAASQGAGGLTDRAAAARSLGRLIAYVHGLVQRKRREPGQDLISDLVAAIPDPALDDRIAGMGAMVLFAGHETTVTRIDVGTVLLASHPEQYAALGADPALVPAAVEEILRMAAPSGIGLPRYAHADIPVGEVTIRTGDAVLLMGSAANRDPAVFADADRFDITRADNPHLAFGHGIRYCLGAALARVELAAVFTALPRRFPALRLDVPVEALELRTDLLTGGLTTLPVRW